MKSSLEIWSPSVTLPTSRKETLFTGWIHAVLTPLDSLVFGGNFLHRFNIGMQMRIYEMELRLNTPLKFCHPCYEALTWFAAANYLREMRESLDDGTSPPCYLVDGLKELVYSFKEWTRTREGMKTHGAQVPPDLHPPKLIEQLTRVIQRAKKLSNVSLDEPLIGSDRRRRGRTSPRDNGWRRASPRRRGRGEDAEEGVGEKSEQPQWRKSITMKLATSETKVIRRSSDSGELH